MTAKNTLEKARQNAGKIAEEKNEFISNRLNYWQREGDLNQGEALKNAQADWENHNFLSRKNVEKLESQVTNNIEELKKKSELLKAEQEKARKAEKKAQEKDQIALNEQQRAKKAEEALYKQKADNFHPGFLRQRRNLILCSLLLLVLGHGEQISKLSFSGFEIGLTKGSFLVTALWLGTIYFIIRYIHYLIEFESPQDIFQQSKIRFGTDYIFPIIFCLIGLYAGWPKISFSSLL